MEGELYVKPSHKERYSQQCEMIKAKLMAGDMWHGIRCQNEDCDKWMWRAQQLAENLKQDHKGDHKGGF